MNYPTITDYLNSIESQNCFKKLRPTFLRDDRGDLIFYSGRESLILKVIIDNKLYALKLYNSYNKHRAQYFSALSSYVKNENCVKITEFKYLNDELTIYIDGEYRNYPALLMEWIEGVTLSDRVKKLAILGLKSELLAITDSFIKFANELIISDITHLDLKPENIIVNQKGELRLIDIDAIYIPNYTPEIVSEQGTEWYRHPNRKEHTYDKYLHDYPIVVIICSLLTLEQMPEMFELHSNGDNFIFSPYNILQGKDKGYIKACEVFKNTIYRDVFMALDTINVKIDSIEKFINIISYVRFKRISTPVTENALAYFDEYITINDYIYAVNYLGLWSFISSDGQMITPFIFTKINRLSENKIVLQKDNLWHIYDDKFKLTSSFNADDATFFSKNRLPVKLNNKWGYMNNNARLVINYQFESAKRFNDSLKAEVKEAGKLKEIDINGK